MANKLHNLSVLTQNCNSLNISTIDNPDNSLNRFKQKMFSLLETKSDIIFLQDIRAGDKCWSIEQLFTVNPFACYRCFFNSTKSSRGVMICIKNTVDCQVVREFKNPDQNSIFLEAFICYTT